MQNAGYKSRAAASSTSLDRVCKYERLKSAPLSRLECQFIPISPKWYLVGSQRDVTRRFDLGRTGRQEDRYQAAGSPKLPCYLVTFSSWSRLQTE